MDVLDWISILRLAVVNLMKQLLQNVFVCVVVVDVVVAAAVLVAVNRILIQNDLPGLKKCLSSPPLNLFLNKTSGTFHPFKEMTDRSIDQPTNRPTASVWSAFSLL